MAARNPTGFTEFLSFGTDVVSNAKPIVSTLADNCFDDQEYILDREQPGIIEMFPPYETNDTSAFSTTPGVGPQPIFTWHLVLKDMCDVSNVVANLQVEWCARVRASDGTTQPQVEVTSANATSNQTSNNTAAAGTSMKWTDFSHGTQNIRTHDNEDTISIKLRVNAGTGSVFIYGFALFVLES